MSERRSIGFHKHQELIGRMRDADPQHASGWDELGDFAEFLARHGKISTTTRDPFNEPLKPLEDTVYKHKYFDFDIEGHSVVVNGERIHLSKMNFDLLNYLVSKRNKVVGRIELIEKVWENYGSEETVKAHISKLRKTLGAGREIPEIIKTVIGVGYMLYDELTDPNRIPQD